VSRAARALVAGIAVLFAGRHAHGGDGGCEAYADGTIGTGATPPVLSELSGLAASRRHPGIYWAHNDSGNAFAIYAVRETGAVEAAFSIVGATGRDPEDIGVGPCTRGDARTCIFVADTGDNLRTRDHVQIVRVVEPETLRTGPLIADTFPFTYPDGPHDAEALLVDPRTAELYLLTKSIVSLGDLYRVELDPRRHVARAVHLGSPSLGRAYDGMVTAASVHPSATRILVRTYARLWEFRKPGATSIADVLLTGTPRAVPTARQLQGEAVSYTADGTGYLLGAEGERSPLVRVGCAPTHASIGPLAPRN